MEINKRTLKILNNMKDFCDFDMKKQVATVNLRYETVDELIDASRSTARRPVISAEAIKSLEIYLDAVPKEFTVRFSFAIDDYQGYDPKLFLDVLNKSLESSYYSVDNHEMSANVLWTLLAVVGLTIILFRVLGTKYEWFGTSGTLISLILISFLEVFSEVFFEESFMFFAISESHLEFFIKKFRRLDSLAVKTGSGENICSIENNSLTRNWVGVSKPFIFAKNYLLAFGFFSVVLTAIPGVPIIFDFSTDNIDFQVFNLIAFALAIVVLLSNLSYYREKYFLREYALLISILLCIIEVGILVSSVFSGLTPISLIVVSGLTVMGSLLNFCALLYVWKCRYE